MPLMRIIRVFVVLSFLSMSASVVANHMMVSPATYKQLQKLEALINEGRLDDAQIRGVNLLKKKVLNSYEKSIIQQMLAGIYIQNENYPPAIKAFQTILSLDELPKSNLLNIHYTLAQLYMQSEDYNNALNSLKIWLDQTEQAKSEAWHFLASIHVAQEQYPEAILPAKKALALAQVKNESHYQLLLGLYQRTNKNNPAIQLLGKMIERFPENKEYWMQLFYMLNKVGLEKQALAILDLTYINKLLKDSDELVQLAQLHLYHENPLRAAVILESGMETGTIEVTQSRLQLLSSAWFNAREHEKLLAVLIRLAKLSGDGLTYYQLAQTYRELSRWHEVINALHMAFNDKGLKNTGACYLLMGHAYFELKDYHAAQIAFEKSLSDKRTQSEAKKWIDYTASFIE